MEVVHFYYKDYDIIQSLYSQLFSGLLKEITSTEQSQEEVIKTVSGDGNAEVSVMMAKGDFGINVNNTHNMQSMQSQSETITPHDAAILDVLNKLTPAMKNNLSDAKRGDIINIKGIIYFIPKELEVICINALDPLVDSMINNQFKNKQTKEKMSLKSIIKNIFKTSSADIRFIFKDDKGCYYSGFLKKNYFSEDYLSLFFKYQSNPIPCQLIALLEEYNSNLSDSHIIPNSIFESIQQLSSVATSIWSNGLPTNVPITPLVFFMPLNVETE